MIDKMLKGYLEAAQWVDAPEGTFARFPKSEIEKAKSDCQAFVDACGILAFRAVDLYGAENFGRDFWLTRCGHGVGFWDRDELSEKCLQNWYAVDRDGEQYITNERGDTLGDALSAIAYGCSHISKFAYPSLTAYRGWLYFS